MCNVCSWFDSFACLTYHSCMNVWPTLPRRVFSDRVYVDWVYWLGGTFSRAVLFFADADTKCALLLLHYASSHVRQGGCEIHLNVITWNWCSVFCLYKSCAARCCTEAWSCTSIMFVIVYSLWKNRGIVSSAVWIVFFSLRIESNSYQFFLFCNNCIQNESYLYCPNQSAWNGSILDYV